MNNRLLLLSSAYIIAQFVQPMHATPMVEKVRSLFKRTSSAMTSSKEVPVKKDEPISITNRHGNITIKAQWEQSSIGVHVTEKPSARNEEIFNINYAQNANGLCIETNAQSTKNRIKGYIDLEVVVPKGSELHLVTKNGSVSTAAHDISGTIRAETSNGSINVHGAQAHIHATTHKGKITILDAQKDVVAQSTKGSIEIDCTKLDAEHKIWAKADAGKINLNLPGTINATLHAKSEKNVQCDIPVTLTSQTIPLEPATWKKFKQEVDGTIGCGTSKIRMVAGGTIKINNNTAPAA